MSQPKPVTVTDKPTSIPDGLVNVNERLIDYYNALVAGTTHRETKVQIEQFFKILRCFRFFEVFNDSLLLGACKLSFMRTLRIPDDGKTYPLPAGFGTFPLHQVADYADKVPADWVYV